MDPRVDSHVNISTVYSGPDCTYTITHSSSTTPRTDHPVIIFGISRTDGTKQEIIPGNIPASVWKELHLAATTPNRVYRWNGRADNIQIAAYEHQVLFASDGLPGITPRGHMQIIIPSNVCAGWFRIAHSVVGMWEEKLKLAAAK